MFIKHLAALLLLALLGVGRALAGDLVVIVNPAAAEPTRQQITDIYLGKDRAFLPLDQPEAAPIRAAFYQRIADRDVAQMKALWSRIVFTGRGLPPKELSDDAAVKKAVAANPKAIGYIDRSALDASVKLALTLN